MRLFITVLAAGIGLILLTSAASAEASVRVTALDCGSHPRRIRIENQGDAAQSLSGWQLQSDAVEGQPWDLSEVGSLSAGQKVFVFQGHLSPAVDAAAGYFRWGTDEIFNLRANDSSDYVRIVDAQGGTVDQRNCEGLPPGATPAPTTEFDPPPLTVATTTPVPTAAPASQPTAAPVATTVRAPAGTRPAPTGVGGAPAGGAPAAPAGAPSAEVLPVGGGPPLLGEGADTSAPFAAGTILLAIAAFLATLSIGRAEPRP